MYPFTIRLVDRTLQESILQPLRCKIDPGSKVTGIAIVREAAEKQAVITLIELTHRGSFIRDALQARSAKRRRRRSTLRYRAPRFNNRRKPNGWLPPSLRHRLETTGTWINRLRKRAPITALTCETVRFDTQKLVTPDIEGIAYQQGTLLGYEIREYLLEKWGRQCAYCDAKNTPLQVDHITPRSRGGSNRIDNLTLACSSCNLKKSNLPIAIFSPKRAKNICSKPPLRDAAAVNSTRKALLDHLKSLHLPCEVGTGGQTKFNRERLNIPKTHALDAACTGTVVSLSSWQIPTQQIICKGRGSYQRTRSDRFGFPRGFLLRKKRVDGFQTGDQIIAVVPAGKKKGNYIGRVAIRASGNFNVQTTDGVVQGIASKHCRLVQRSCGYNYQRPCTNNGLFTTINNQPPEEQRFLPALKGQVSALSIR